MLNQLDSVIYNLLYLSMKLNHSMIATAILLIVLASCKKGSGPGPSRTADVYVAGFTTASNNITVATYWKNNVATTLEPAKSNSSLNSIVVQDGDTYVAGYFTASNGNQVAAIWKNNQITKLSDSTGNCTANSIFISGTDIYVAGVLNNVAAYWKNGAVTQLPDYELKSVASSIFVEGDKIVVVGNIDNTFGYHYAAFWQNGQLTPIPPTDVQSSAAQAVLYDSNDKLYIAGGSYGPFVFGVTNIYSATFWTSKDATMLGDGKTTSNATSLALNGTDVYVAGNTTASNGASIATYWKNGAATTLAPGTAYGITILNNDLYIAGDYSGGHAVYWQNGVAVKLSNTISSGRGIAVVKL